MLKQYLAVFESQPDHAIGIQFPDFPHFYSYGDTLDEAYAMAADCLKTAIEFYAEEGMDIPEPCDAEGANAILADLAKHGTTPSLHWIPVEVPDPSVVVV